MNWMQAGQVLLQFLLVWVMIAVAYAQLQARDGQTPWHRRRYALQAYGWRQTCGHADPCEERYWLSLNERGRFEWQPHATRAQYFGWWNLYPWLWALSDSSDGGLNLRRCWQ